MPLDRAHKHAEFRCNGFDVRDVTRKSLKVHAEQI